MPIIRNFFNTLGIVALVGFVSVSPVKAQPPTQCPSAPAIADIAAPLPRLAGRLAAGQSIVIVAIGSSSTAGAGASAPHYSYPARLERALARLWPEQQVVVLNRGINGEDAADMRKRFQRDIFDLHPDLVIWQLGTNYLMRNDGVAGFSQAISDGVDALRARGIDVVLMDPQYAPKVLVDPDADAMVAMIAAAARDRHAGLFRRFDLMSNWVQVDEVAMTDMITPDGLHMNDWSYNCVAQSLATALSRAAKSSMFGRAEITY